jgi:hypothetical protein
MIASHTQLLFYKILFLYFQEYGFKILIHILCMQAKPFCYAYKVLLENIFLFWETWFMTVLKHCSEG